LARTAETWWSTVFSEMCSRDGVGGRPGPEPLQQVEGGQQVGLGGAVGQGQRLLIGAAELPPGPAAARQSPAICSR
jgi:hypothetical protein